MLGFLLVETAVPASNLPHLPPQEGDNWHSPDANQSLIVEQKNNLQTPIFS